MLYGFRSRRIVEYSDAHHLAFDPTMSFLIAGSAVFGILCSCALTFGEVVNDDRRLRYCRRCFRHDGVRLAPVSGLGRPVVVQIPRELGIILDSLFPSPIVPLRGVPHRPTACE